MARTHHHYRSLAEGAEPSNWHSRWASPRVVRADRKRDQNACRSKWKVALEQLPLEAWEDGVVIRFGTPNFPGHVH